MKEQTEHWQDTAYKHPFVVQASGWQRNLDERKHTLEELQQLVHGYIEIVPVGRKVVAVVNEDGRSLNLDINERASALAGMELVGDVVFIRKNWL